MKRILYFFPENPMEKDAGNKIRAMQLLEYFKDRDFKVDFVSLRQGMSEWSEEDVKEFKQSGWIEQLYFLQKKPSKKNRVKYFFQFKIPDYYYKRKLGRGSSLNTDISWNQKKVFEDILKVNQYNHIVISYLYWADLINSSFVCLTNTVVDTHDLLTLHHTRDAQFKLGSTWEDEISKLNLFDEAWAISTDEQFVFSQFGETKTKLVPPFFSKPLRKGASDVKNHDLIYVASDNPHNIRSISWFFKEVYPLLPLHFRICIVGKITRVVEDYPNVYKEPFVQNLHDFYTSSKIVVCPMLTGTGVKIKVVEALAYGLPVVCTTRGVDGLPNKINNGCLVSDSADGFAGNIISLLQDPVLYQKQSQMGSDLFDQYFEKARIYEVLDQSFLNDMG